MLPFLSTACGASIAAFGVCKTWQAQTISLVEGSIRLRIGVAFDTHLLAVDQRTYLHKKIVSPVKCLQWVARHRHVVYDARRVESGWKLPCAIESVHQKVH
ncbi:hypothetical protein [Pseudomonas syringae]|uniref:hypothetical protein n=1 Tax=Pseudomonas syringae TaxID=317 RepID=UPI0015E164D2|nr:hypothetical protein [Pseudomonas syringae]